MSLDVAFTGNNAAFVGVSYLWISCSLFMPTICLCCCAQVLGTGAEVESDSTVHIAYGHQVGGKGPAANFAVFSLSSSRQRELSACALLCYCFAVVGAAAWLPLLLLLLLYRALMQHGDEWPKKYDLSTLRVIGSVGEPINPEAWRWYFTNVGRSQCSVVDTYWQTETGGHVLAPFPGATVTKPGCAMVPFFGVEPAIVDPQSGEEKTGNNVCGVLCIKRSWPGTHFHTSTTSPLLCSLYLCLVLFCGFLGGILVA